MSQTYCNNPAKRRRKKGIEAIVIVKERQGYIGQIFER